MKTMTAQEEAQDLEMRLMAWLHVDSVTNYGAMPRSVMAVGPYAVEGIVRTDLGPGLPEGARNARMVLLQRAEDALETLEAAGWHLTGCPVMEFSGEVRPFTQTLDGKLVEPSRQQRIMLKVRLEVNRVRG